jgi:hypothetical protein
MPLFRHIVSSSETFIRYLFAYSTTGYYKIALEGHNIALRLALQGYISLLFRRVSLGANA